MASIYLFKPPYAIRLGPSLSGRASAYRWCSLPRVHRHRASKPQGSSKRVLPWQITMDQLLFASLSHTHYWYEVGMLRVPTELKTPSEIKAVPASSVSVTWRTLSHTVSPTVSDFLDEPYDEGPQNWYKPKPPASQPLFSTPPVTSDLSPFPLFFAIVRRAAPINHSIR